VPTVAEPLACTFCFLPGWAATNLPLSCKWACPSNRLDSVVFNSMPCNLETA